MFSGPRARDEPGCAAAPTASTTVIASKTERSQHPCALEQPRDVLQDQQRIPTVDHAVFVCIAGALAGEGWH